MDGGVVAGKDKWSSRIEGEQLQQGYTGCQNEQIVGDDAIGDDFDRIGSIIRNRNLELEVAFESYCYFDPQISDRWD